MNMEITESSVCPTHEDVIKDLMDTLAEMNQILSNLFKVKLLKAKVKLICQFKMSERIVLILKWRLDLILLNMLINLLRLKFKTFICYLCKLKSGSIDNLCHRLEDHGESVSDDGSGYASKDMPSDVGDSSTDAVLPLRVHPRLSL